MPSLTFNLYFVCIYVVYMYMCVQYPEGPKGDNRSPGAEVTGVCEPPCKVLGIEP